MDNTIYSKKILLKVIWKIKEKRMDIQIYKQRSQKDGTIALGKKYSHTLFNIILLDENTILLKRDEHTDSGSDNSGN